MLNKVSVTDKEGQKTGLCSSRTITLKDIHTKPSTEMHTKAFTNTLFHTFNFRQWSMFGGKRVSDYGFTLHLGDNIKLFD